MEKKNEMKDFCNFNYLFNTH